MSTIYTCIALIKTKENLHVHNTSHGTVITRIETKEIPKVYLLLKLLLRVTMFTSKAPAGGVRAGNTK
jgi:hypothetical protein